MISTGISNELFLVICGAGVLQSLFLGIYVLSTRTKENASLTVYLSMLFLLLALRVAKSAVWIINPEVSELLLNIGFAAHLAIGPTLFIYLIRFLEGARFKIHQITHYVPALICLVGAPILTLDNFWYPGGYTALLVHQLVYYFLCIYLILAQKRNSFRELEKNDKLWLIALIIGTGVLQLAYASNYLLGLTSYAWGPILYSLIIYGVSFIGLRRNGFFLRKMPPTKYENINLSNQEYDRYKSIINETMVSQKLFLQPDLTQQKLSEATSIPSYLISHIINQSEGVNFSTYLNKFRIEEAKLKLSNSELNHLTIAAIAYDCGFNSLSSFNHAFKKVVGRTPSEFRKG